ncbi:MAG: glycosyltransferase family 4 protein [Patescibacteria group bacterium]|jgi:glycosyltransferase involved in cell wall biosynthesis
MKIYIIGQKGIPAVGGGVETHVDNLAVKLAKLGYEVFAYTRHNYSDRKIKEYQGVKLISLPSIKTKNLDAISHTFLACLDFVFRRKADVIHFHSIGPASLIWLVKLFRPKMKVVFTFHSQCYYNTKWGGLAKIYLAIGERVGCRLADEVIVVSKTLKKYVEEKYNRAVNYIPNGVNLPKPSPAKIITEKWNLEKDSYILSVSRIVKNKGLEYLIEAYKKIKTDKKLVIVGDGDFSDKLIALAENNPNIIFTGRQSGETLNELFSNARLFIQPSEAEGLSISLLEAVSYQLPVLISDIEANLEVMGEDSFSFKNKNVEDLEKKLGMFLNGENAEALDKNIKNVYNKIMSEYNWDNIIKSTINLY